METLDRKKTLELKDCASIILVDVMNVYISSDARQNLASILEEAATYGEVSIKRRDGKVFVIKFSQSEEPPLDVEGVNIGLSSEEIIQFIDEGRKKV